VKLGESAFRVSRDRRHAVLQVNNLPVIDTFVIFGPNDTPASMNFRIEWNATGPRNQLGSGDAVAETDPAAFLGGFRRARAEARLSGSEVGFSFRSQGKATSKLGFAELGTERNGVFI
jgi:hypothetical protein